MKDVANFSKDFEMNHKRSKTFKNLFLCSHLSIILKRNPETDLRLSCFSQMLMIVIIVPYMNKSPLQKRPASVCSVSVDDVPNGGSVIFLAHLPHFMKEMIWFQKSETVDPVKSLDEFIQKLDVVASVIFTLIDVKGESESKQKQPCYFSMISFRQWLVFLLRQHTISQEHCGMLSHGLLSFSNQTCVLYNSNS